MKNLKSLTTLFAFCMLLSSSAFGSGMDTEPTVTWKAQFINYLSDMNFDKASDVPHRIMVDFMINDNAEIIVLSTSERSLDNTIKAKLNYKKISTDDLEYNQKYTLPVIFRK